MLLKHHIESQLECDGDFPLKAKILARQCSEWGAQEPAIGRRVYLCFPRLSVQRVESDPTKAESTDRRGGQTFTFSMKDDCIATVTTLDLPSLH
jgi:hypothetical protein